MKGQEVLFSDMEPEYASKHPCGLNFNTNTDDNEVWLSPLRIIKALGPFDLDPCACDSPRPWATAKEHYEKALCDGLAMPWLGRVWLNPPYGDETFKWMSKLAHHKSGIALIFSRTETKGFHREIWQKAKCVFFFEGRLVFHEPDGKLAKAGANAPSCLVAYSDFDTEAIERAMLLGKIKGKMILL